MNDPHTNSLARLRQEAVRANRAEFENEAASTRQKFAASRSAVRLLTGAYAFREVTDHEYCDALDRIAATEGITVDVQAHRACLSRMRQRLGLPPHSKRLRNIARGQGVLVVTDPNACGWAEFFEAVFGGVRVAVVDPVTAEFNLCVPDDLAIVFHDLSSGASPDDRIGIVERIKRKHFDLPLMVFSERDDVREMWRCLRAGASGYFCYEPEAGHDRESVATFEQFAGMARDAIPPELWRHLWKELNDFTGPIPGSHGSALYRRARGHLRRAYWFLTADTTDPRTRLLAANNLYNHVLMACGAAVETVLREAYTRYHKRMGTSREMIGELTVKMRAIARLLTEVGEITPEQESQFRAIWTRRNAATHKDREISRAQAEKMLSDTIALLHGYFTRFDHHPDE